MTLDQFKNGLAGPVFTVVGGINAPAFQVTNDPHRRYPLPAMFVAAERLDPGDYVGLDVAGRLVRLHIEEGKDVR